MEKSKAIQEQKVSRRHEDLGFPASGATEERWNCRAALVGRSNLAQDLEGLGGKTPLCIHWELQGWGAIDVAGEGFGRH